MSSSILFASPSRALLETDNPRARAEVAYAVEGAFVWVVRVGVLRFVGLKCCWSGLVDGRAGRGIVGGGAKGAGRAEICRRRIGRCL
jgi:hypothetical protein